MSGEQYDEDYFLHGKETGKSLYENYRWMPDLTIPMVVRTISHCGIKPNHSILDFGCARGYLVRAFREMGYQAQGYDTSQWAIDNADDVVKDYVTNDANKITGKYDWVIAKDVLEHVEVVSYTIPALMQYARRGVFVVVPLSAENRDNYVVPEYEKDVTHIHRFTLGTWVNMFLRPGWSVEASYRVPGVKDNYAQYEKGNGFITCRRLSV